MACPGPLASSMAPLQPHLSPVSVPSLQEARARGEGVSPGNAEWTQPCLQPILGVDFQFLPYVGWTWPSHGEPLVLLSYDHSLVLVLSITGSPGILGPNFLHLKPYLLTPVVHIASSPSLIVKPPLIRSTCAETWWTATFWAFTRTSGGGWRPLLEAQGTSRDLGFQRLAVHRDVWLWLSEALPGAEKHRGP